MIRNETHEVIVLVIERKANSFFPPCELSPHFRVGVFRTEQNISIQVIKTVYSEAMKKVFTSLIFLCCFLVTSVSAYTTYSANALYKVEF